MTTKKTDNSRFVLGRGMSPEARARDTEQSDREYIKQRQKRQRETAPNVGSPSTPKIMNEINYNDRGVRKWQEEMNRPGGVGNPFICDIPEDAWQPTGDFSTDDAGNVSDPLSRLSVKIQLAGIKMHVEAIQIKDGQEQVEAANPQLDQDIASLYQMAGWEGECPDTLEIHGRRYIITAWPFA